MKLLVFTQKVDINDDVLGFFHTWLIEFAKRCEKIVVICLEKGEYELPENVKVLSLEKEKFKIQNSKFKIHKKFIYLINFYKYIWQEWKNYDAVFAHMNPIYVILGGLFWRLSNRKIILWYTHRQVDLKLRIAEKLAGLILTASKESFQLQSRKIKILGHGIDTEKFIPFAQQRDNEKFTIAYVGRISRIKNQKLLVKAADYLVNKENIKDIQIDFVGNPVYKEDKKLLGELEDLIEEKNLKTYINFIGSVPNKDIDKIYQQADLSINLCPTGGLDKAVLESMACGLPVIVFNKSFQEVLGEYQKELVLNDLDEKELAWKILTIKNWDWEKRKTIGRGLRETVVQKHGLGNLINKIIGCYE